MKKPTSAYLICATPRTGSTLLCDLLRSTGVAGIPREYFNRGFVPFNRARWRAATDAKYYAGLMRHGLTRNGVFGSKVMFMETRLLEAIIRAAHGLPELPAVEGNWVESWDPDPEVLAEGLPGLRYVRIRRDDVYRQAISYFTAQKTKLWSWEGEEWQAGEVPDDLQEIAHLEYHLKDGDPKWDAWLERHGISALLVTYEDLSADPVGVTEGVLAFLGIESTVPLVATLRKQAGARSEELYERYRAARAAGEVTLCCPREQREAAAAKTDVPA